jgi:FAD/FMN-containing dehydrogenase/Fe-S oxidoreductase
VGLDQERQRIQDDLRGLISGEVRCDDIFVQMYSSDASIYELRPLGVVRPRNTADVVAVVNYARENGHTIHPRGAGTGLVGGCLGRGIIVDLSRYMRRVLDIDGDLVRVQPGVVLAQLNQQLRSYQRHYGVDPLNAEVTTMGSVLAIDAKGSRWPRYGTPRRHVRHMKVVLASGDEVELHRNHPVDAKPPGDSPVARITQGVVQIIRNHADEIKSNVPLAIVNSAGYRLHDVLNDHSIDLASIMVGSEGTLGIITEATLETHALPAHAGVLLLFFDRVEKAARAALEIRTSDVVACDLMDRRLLSLARESDVRYDVLLPKAAEAMLLVECEDEDASRLGQRLGDLAHQITSHKKLAFDSRTAIDSADYDVYWSLAKRVVPMLYRLKGTQRAVPFVEDVAVPPDVLPQFLVTAQNVLKRHQVTASFFVHAAHGQVQLRPFIDVGDPDDIWRLHQLASDLYEEVISIGGTISAQHGDGLSRSWFLRQLSGTIFPVYREIKSVFDPGSVLNPSKIADSHLHRPTQNIRASVLSQDEPPGVVESNVPGTVPNESVGAKTANKDPLPSIELLLNWDEVDDIHNVVRACNGCGDCRTQSQMMRMCPIFRFAPTEEASPRAKANLMRGLLTGQLSSDELVSDELKAVADLCVHCYQCREECPAGVNIPKLMVECKAQYVASNGLRFADWLLTRIDIIAAWAIKAHWLSNFAIRNRRTRWLVEKTIGIAQGRKLPTFAPRSFMSQAARMRLNRPSRSAGPKVLFFTDIYANWFDVQLAECMVSVFQHNGISIYVHPRQKQSGMSLVLLGAIEKARRLARRNVLILAEAVRQGYKIVTTEPSAALCISQEYPNLVIDEDARLVADNTFDACDYLWKLHQQGKLELDFKPTTAVVGYHLPCHLRALEVGSPGENLLKLIPGLSVKRLDKGCSGMAGTFGLHRENFRNSLRAGWPLIKAMRDPALPVGTTECSACKIQMEQGTTKPTIHPLKLLALSYGLQPDVAQLLRQESGPLTIT